MGGVKSEKGKVKSDVITNIDNFIILHDNHPVNLEIQVKSHLTEGWVLHGVPFLSGLGSYDCLICQAMVKREKL